ncbi:probable calcium-binding protein CML45 [Mangifera indica]|uniref:probable calcium-binding protein CML45 n=1 Tax=Mangifera indica TaxID=29780 RepID=UPI001CF9E9FE|nr:probable calcium-binding protein CML45 [Mangifera indica]
MEKSSSSSSADKNTHQSFFSFVFVPCVIVSLFERFFTLVHGVHNLLSGFLFSLFKLHSCHAETCNDLKSRDSADSRSYCFQEKQDDGEGDDDGSLLREEVEMVMKNLTLFCGPGGEELPGKMGSREFSGLFEEKEPSFEEVKEAFDVYDQNKDGFIDERELLRVFRLLGMKEGFELENCRKMIGKFDENGDGMIDFKEFVKFMEKSFVEL